MKPPEYLDGAKVLLWDWSDGQPFVTSITLMVL